MSRPSTHAGASPQPAAHGELLVSRTSIALLAGLVSLALFPVAGSAQEIPKMGLYIGLGLDLAVEDFEDFDNGEDFDTGVGFLLTVGYRFHPNISFEGSVEFLDHVDSNDFDPNLDASILAFNGNFKGYLTTQRVQPFVLLGMGITRFQFRQDGGKDNDVGVTAHFGGGLDYYLMPQVSIGLTVSYVVTSGKIEDLNHTTIGMGAQYRF
jgi:opacity protein-like surface antigen